MGAYVYPHFHKGAALIVGSAPCVYDDLRTAAMPRAVRIGVNEGVGAALCQHLVTQHPEHIQYFLKLHRERHPGQPDPLVHCPSPTRDEDRQFADQVDFWWENTRIRATSTASAICIATDMGFKPILLCGCPMTGGDGYYLDTTGKDSPDNPRFGMKSADDNLVKTFQEKFRGQFTLPGWEHVRSLSGFTREVLGGPSWQD